MTTLERVLARVEHSGDCWEWTGKLNNGGYGATSDNHRHVYVHRYVYSQIVGPIPEGLVLDHLCRNRKCCNPAHLEPVTQAENINRSIDNHRNVRKTHCPQGHEYATDGRVRKNGTRQCIPCKQVWDRARYHRKKQAA